MQLSERSLLVWADLVLAAWGDQKSSPSPPQSQRPSGLEGPFLNCAPGNRRGSVEPPEVGLTAELDGVGHLPNPPHASDNQRPSSALIDPAFPGSHCHCKSPSNPSPGLASNRSQAPSFACAAPSAWNPLPRTSFSSTGNQFRWYLHDWPIHKSPGHSEQPLSDSK